MIYPFDYPHTVNGGKLKSLIGGKGAGLNWMAKDMGLPVPGGFTIPCSHTKEHATAQTLTAGLKEEFDEAVANLETQSGLRFGDPKNPLLVSVRSGAPVSMPGMMETVLNLGMTTEVTDALADKFTPEFAWNSYFRFIKMYGTIVNNMPKTYFDDRIRAAEDFFGESFNNFPIELIKLLCELINKEVKVPSDPLVQLERAVVAVFRSWYGAKAESYRKIEKISKTIGTAVNVQRMVFGNMNDRSGTGVLFTRDPNTGEPVPYGDFLVNAQGEDVVDGSHTTTPINRMPELGFGTAYDNLLGFASTIERYLLDMADIEFTIENDVLYVLQCRAGKRAAPATVRIAFDLYDDGIINRDMAVERINKVIGTGPVVKESNSKAWKLVGKFGTPATTGTATGKAVFSAKEAEKCPGECILITHETSPEDIAGMAAANGIFTLNGGLVSHAAVVARGWNKTCIVGAGGVNGKAAIGNKKLILKVDPTENIIISEGDEIMINGQTGEVYVRE